MMSVGVALLGDPKESIVLSDKGQVVKKHIENIINKVKNVEIDEYIIMPNHIHFNCVLRNRSSVIKWVAQESDLYKFVKLKALFHFNFVECFFTFFYY